MPRSVPQIYGVAGSLAQGSQWFTIASTPWAKTVISKDRRKKLSALMIRKVIATALQMRNGLS
jgi:hypothetical protein